MRYLENKSGYSLVEVLVAITILMLSIVGPITIASKSMQSAQYARQQTTAFFLAQEGISIANTIRNDTGVTAYWDTSVTSWSWTTNPALAPCFDPDGCDIDFRDASLTSNVVNCSTVANCLLRFDAGAARAAYQHVSGTNSPYTRVLTFTLDGDEVRVVSRVSWDSTLMGGTQEVELTTSLFNLFDY
jgi:type II secretory pathway pseudopilin PulG